MKTAILCFPKVSWNQVQMPIGLYKIKSFCSHEYQVKIVDARIENAEEIIQATISNNDTLCLGLSVMTGSQITEALRLSEKFHNELPIVWGGIHPTIMPKETIENLYIDYIISGDGEEAFLELLHYLDHKDTLKNKFVGKDSRYTYHRNSLKDLEKSSIDFLKADVPSQYFIRRDGFNKAIAIETSRGCPHRCGFCHNTILGHKYRSVCPSSVILSIKQLQEKYQIDGIVFQEDNFFLDQARAFNIINFLAKNPMIRWKANSRISYFYKFVKDHSFMDMIINSGCNVLQFGIESGSNRILNNINKRIEISDVIKTNIELSKYNIRIKYNFIVGFPTETIDEIKETEALIQRLLGDNPNAESPFVNIYTPYPGTTLYRSAIQDGFIPPTSLEDWGKINWNSVDYDRWPRKINEYINNLSNKHLVKSNYLK